MSVTAEEEIKIDTIIDNTDFSMLFTTFVVLVCLHIGIYLIFYMIAVVYYMAITNEKSNTIRINVITINTIANNTIESITINLLLEHTLVHYLI